MYFSSNNQDSSRFQFIFPQNIQIERRSKQIATPALRLFTWLRKCSPFHHSPQSPSLSKLLWVSCKKITFNSFKLIISEIHVFSYPSSHSHLVILLLRSPSERERKESSKEKLKKSETHHESLTFPLVSCSFPNVFNFCLADVICFLSRNLFVEKAQYNY